MPRVRYPAALQARISLRQAGQLARLAEAAHCSEAEVVRYALHRLFSRGGSTLVEDLVQDLGVRYDADEELG